MSAIQDILVRAAQAILAVLTPARDRTWAMAMIAEWRHFGLERGESGRWIASCFRAAAILRFRDFATRCLVLFASAALLTVYVDRQTEAAMPPVSLIILLGLGWGYFLPRQKWRGCLLAGGLLPVAHAVANLRQDLWPYYQCRALDVWDWLILASLFVPASAGVFAGIQCRFASRQQA